MGVCDLDHGRALSCAARFGVPAVHADAVSLLEGERPELVSVCTPDATHAELVALALRAPATRGVLAEKPLALDSRTAAALAAEARERGVVLAVNYTRRFAPAFAALDLAALGELRHVSGSCNGGLRHNGTHWLDLLRMLAGEPVAARGRDRLGDAGPDPALDAELELRQGAVARLTAVAGFGAFEMELTGTRGRIRVADAGHRLERWTAGPDARHPGHRALRLVAVTRGALRDATLHAVADLVRCVREGAAPLCGGADASAALAIAEAVAASAASGRTEPVGPYSAP